MARSRAYRRHQEARARARALRIVRLWGRDPAAASPSWFGVCVSTHCRPCSCAGCSPRHEGGTLQSRRADLSYGEALAAAGF